MPREQRHGTAARALSRWEPPSLQTILPAPWMVQDIPFTTWYSTGAGKTMSLFSKSSEVPEPLKISALQEPKSRVENAQVLLQAATTGGASKISPSIPAAILQGINIRAALWGITLRSM